MFVCEACCLSLLVLPAYSTVESNMLCSSKHTLAYRTYQLSLLLQSKILEVFLLYIHLLINTVELNISQQSKSLSINQTKVRERLLQKLAVLDSLKALSN